MILLSFAERPETRDDTFPCDAFRWAIETHASRTDLSIELVRQHRWRATGVWDSSHTTVYGLALRRQWRWGQWHGYYDGPHCLLNLGPLQIQWAGNLFTGECAKCSPSR